MIFTCYVIDEKRLGPELSSPGAILTQLQRYGADWGTAEASEEQLMAMFGVLDRFAGTRTLLATLARRGSPRHALLASLEPWRMGYFQAGLVRHLHVVLRSRADAIGSAMAMIGDAAELLCYRFTSSVEEASARGGAVAIRHHG